MIAYVGQTRSSTLVPQLRERGIREMRVAGEAPPYRVPYAWDNGLFRHFKAGRLLDDELGREIAADMNAMDAQLLDGQLYPPDFMVAPDIVCGGVASLRVSAAWAYEMRCAGWDHIALAVQNGMQPADVLPVLGLFSVIFVGGDLRWKLDTGASWVSFAHEHGLRCHVGRVGTPKRVLWARRIGADSIDSCFPLFTRENLRQFLEALEVEDPNTFEDGAQPGLL